MMDSTDSASTSLEATTVAEEEASKPKNMCEVCTSQVYKYTCPRCTIHTCSLPCVKRHKEETGCNGQRSKTAFIPLEEYSERDLIRDFRFLEEINEKIQLAKKERMNWTKPNDLPEKVKNRKMGFRGGWRKRYGRGHYRRYHHRGRGGYKGRE